MVLLIICILSVKSSFGFVFLLLFYISLIVYRNISKRAEKNRFFNFLKKFCKLGYTLFFISFIFIEGTILKDIFSNRDKVPQVDYLIVLGAGLRGESPSEVLKYRLREAVKYYALYPDTIFILSGGQGADEPLTEAEAMKRYLVRKGIPEKNIIKEEKSTSTYENLQFSNEILKNSNSKNAGVMSNSFHMYRVKMIAAKLNIPLKTVYAGTPEIVFPNYMLREYFAYFNEKRK